MVLLIALTMPYISLFLTHHFGFWATTKAMQCQFFSLIATSRLTSELTLHLFPADNRTHFSPPDPESSLTHSATLSGGASSLAHDHGTTSTMNIHICRTARLAAGAEVAGGDQRARVWLAHDGRVVLVDADDPRHVRYLPRRPRREM